MDSVVGEAGVQQMRVVEKGVINDGDTVVLEEQADDMEWARGVVRKISSWKPGPARYDAGHPPKFTLTLNLLFALAGCFTVSNLYYNQAVLNRIAETFCVSFERASLVATLMQAGYAAGLLLICPLGDIFPRRPFILSLVFFTATLWLGLCLTSSFPPFAALSFLCGTTTVTPQLLLPLVGDLAPAHRRASSLAYVVSGLSLGILIARILAGVMANYTEWRNIYWFSLAAQYFILMLLYIWLPDYPSKNPEGLNYFKMLFNVFYLLFTEPLLLQASVVSFLISAVYTSYWTTLSFLLSSPPYSYSSAIIGLFGLIGVVLTCTAPIYGRFVIDNIVPFYSALLGLLVDLVGLFVGTSIGSFNVAGPILQAIAIDLGFQCTQIANRAAIYSIKPDARNRINTAYMLAAFSGQLTGTSVGNRLYAQCGWRCSGSFGIACIGLALLVCIMRGPRESGWMGWSGSWALRRDELSARKPVAAEAREEAGVNEESQTSLPRKR